MMKWDSEGWGPWVDNAMPVDGMYIQLKAIDEDTGETGIFEGIVYDADSDGFSLRPEPPVWGWEAIEWRERKPRGLTILEALLQSVDECDKVGGDKVKEDA